MPTGVYIRTEDNLKGIRAFNRKKFGKPFSLKARKNMSDARKGMKFSEKHIENLRLSHLGKSTWNKGIACPQMTGKNHWHWKGGYKNTLWLRKQRRILKLNISGFHTDDDWETLKAQYNWTCPCCKKSEPEIKLTEDHIIPITKGGSDNIENIQPLCRSCNSRKSNKIIIKYNRRNL